MPITCPPANHSHVLVVVRVLMTHSVELGHGACVAKQDGGNILCVGLAEKTRRNFLCPQFVLCKSMSFYHEVAVFVVPPLLALAVEISAEASACRKQRSGGVEILNRENERFPLHLGEAPVLFLQFRVERTAQSDRN